MRLALLDWLVIGAYVVFAFAVGVVFARRAGRDSDEYFLAGRTLPWWLAGTSMVATTFAADTPLVVSAWVRDHGIWKNWVWWAFAVGGMAAVFAFARYWRRGGVMTTAELAELRYGGSGARVLRGFLGVYHAAITNTIILCWVLLAATKILDVLLDVPKEGAVVAACLVALTYSLLAGFWGVVVTDLVQFSMAVVGAVALAALSWSAVGGADAILEAISDGRIAAEVVSFAPAPGAGGPLDATFWTAPFAAFAVYLGVSWWAMDAVDGGGLVVQRIAASRDERQGMLACLWYNLAHYALRPWPWICVGLASLLVLPTLEVEAPVSGTVAAVEADAVVIEAAGGPTRVSLAGEAPDWGPLPAVAVGDAVERGDVVARTDSERAYPTMMSRYLPAGLLGLVVASLLAAFMSTIDTHVNLASSFFVNDLYRRFLAPGRGAGHYVLVARLASVGVLAFAGFLALEADSISDLFLFFLAFLGGVGPVYLARWLWWRVRASTEIAAMLASSATTVALTVADVDWSFLGPLADAGALRPEGRLCLVVLVSLAAAGLSLLLTRAPDPATLVAFYRRVRPIGAWGPVRALAPDVEPPREGRAVLLGIAGGLAATYGALFGVGRVLLGEAGSAAGWLALAGAGALAVLVALRSLRTEPGVG